MSHSRFTLAALCLALLGLVGAGFYLYQNLPAILKAQLRYQLHHYGVQDVDYTTALITGNALRVDELRLRGAHGGIAWEAHANSVELRYDWRTLIAGRIQSLTVPALHLSLEHTTTSDQPAPVDINLDALIPHDLFEQLPLQTLQVKDWQVNYRSAGLPQVSARGNLLMDGHLDLQLASTIAGGEVTAALRVATNPPVLDLALALREGDADTALASAQLTQAGSGAWAWDLDAQWQYAPLLQWLRQLDTESGLTLPMPAAQDLYLHGQTTITAAVRHPAQLRLGSAPGQPARLPEQLVASIHAVNEIRQLDCPGTIEKLSGTVALDAQLESSRLSATMQPSEFSGNLAADRLSLSAGTLRWLGWAQTIPVHWKSAAPLLVAFDQHGSGSLAVRDTALTLGGADTALGLHGLQLDAAFTASEPMQLDTRLDASVNARLQHFDLVNEDMAVRSGRVNLDTTLKGEAFALASWSQQSRLVIEDVSGSVGDYRFDGLAFSANWSGITHWQTQEPAEISLANLDLGFPVRDVLAHVSLPRATPIASPLLRIDKFSAGLFGGRLLMAQPQTWDFAAPSNRLTLQAQQWQLADLVALQKNTDIRAQGTLEGELPMTITGGRIIIENGYLHALPPGGSIRYTPNDASRSLASGSAELGLALDLLSDFHYQVLSSRVRLDAAGNLLLGLSLQGSNPARYEGQPINFNINLEQNLDPLLQSWRLSGKLVEQIEGALQ
jgi:hypothetical protein